MEVVAATDDAPQFLPAFRPDRGNETATGTQLLQNASGITCGAAATMIAS